MRKRGKPAREQEGQSWPLPAEQTHDDSAPEPDNGLEDDGLVFWPSNLGQPEGPRLVQVGPRPRRQEPAKPRPPRRLATTILFALLFFAGAALTAAAGNEVATLVASDTQSAESQGVTTTDPAVSTNDGSATTSTDAAQSTGSDQTSTDGATTTAVEATTAAEPGSSDTTTSSETDNATNASEPAIPPGGDQPADTGAGTSPFDSSTTVPSQPSTSESAAATAPDNPVVAAPTSTTAPEAQPQPLLTPTPEAQPSEQRRADRSKSAYSSLKTKPRLDQIEPEGNSALGLGEVHWINQPLPDPTPPSLRLSAQFARELRATSAANGLDWSFLLAVLRAERLNDSGQVAQAVMEREAAALAPLHLHVGDRRAALAYKHDPLFAERVLVLVHYYRALGLQALVEGLAADRDKLAARLLADPRIDIYPGGRSDISSGRVDVRVLAMIAFLSESFGDVRVSCLITGHRLYARPGVISAHIFGRGLDIGALDEISIFGHQQPGGVTEQAVRQILLLPAEVMPRQVISLLGLGGPSFPLADHNDHIHIGY